jgi:oxygen-independent coproporphyrinogen III oxidase
MNFPKHLIDKYNVPVPRYTSYPPANFFAQGITHNEAVELYSGSNRTATQHIAFYIHIPFCHKICHYCGCNSYTFGKGNSVEEYVNALKKEILMMVPLIDRSRPVTQIHYGGGTPNAIDARYLHEINELIFTHFNIAPEAEIAIETNPAHLDFAYIDQLKAARFNRISLGIQDFDPVILKTVNREPSALPVQALIDYLRKGDQPMRVNLDFIYGLPGQTVESFNHTMEQAIQLRPDRLVTFSYAHVPWLKTYQKILERRGLPDAAVKLDMLLHSRALLLDNGYKTLGLDHYVLPDDDLFTAYESHKLHRNFQGYCTRETTGQVYAFGVSGISQLDEGYIQSTKSIADYVATIEQGRFAVDKSLVLTKDQQLIKEAITQLMCNKNLHWDSMAQLAGVSRQYLLDVLQFDRAAFTLFEDDGLIEMSGEGITVTDTGSFFIRNIAAALDPAYTAAAENRFSKSV